MSSVTQAAVQSLVKTGQLLRFCDAELLVPPVCPDKTDPEADVELFPPTVQVQIGQPLASNVAQVEPQLVGNSGQPLLFMDA